MHKKASGLAIVCLVLALTVITQVGHTSSFPFLETIATTFPRSWTVGDDGLYTGTNCFGSEFTFNATLQEWPIAGVVPGTPTTMGNIVNDINNCGTYTGLAADDMAVYYYDYANDFVAKRTFADPTTEIILFDVPSSSGFSFNSGFRSLELSSTDVYWYGDDGSVWRTPKNGGTLQKFIDASNVDDINDMVITGSRLFMATDHNIYFARTDCAILPCTDLAIVNINPNIFGANNTVETISYGYVAGPVEFVLLYTTDDLIVNLGGDIFVERDTIGKLTCGTYFINPDFVFSCSHQDIYFTPSDYFLSNAVSKNGKIYWEEYDSDEFDTYVYEMTTSGTNQSIIHSQSGLFFYGQVEADNTGVYFRTRNEGVRRFNFGVPSSITLQDSSAEIENIDHKIGLIVLSSVALLGCTLGARRLNV